MASPKVHKNEGVLGGDELVVESGGAIKIISGGWVGPSTATAAATAVTGLAATATTADAAQAAANVAINQIVAALELVGILATE